MTVLQLFDTSLQQKTIVLLILDTLFSLLLKVEIFYPQFYAVMRNIYAHLSVETHRRHSYALKGLFIKPEDIPESPSACTKLDFALTANPMCSSCNWGQTKVSLDGRTSIT